MQKRIEIHHLQLKVAEVFHLTKHEKDEMNILVGKQKDTNASDLPEYIMNDFVSNALRVTTDLNACKEALLRFVEAVRNLRKGTIH